ncbi:hypothetical protein [Nitrosopumilus ureiphilus]|uniref:Peptidase S1 domain-containing protein n=1 Tax=Nitrosopumilus ureiphilus TaxID=1470067 RepID=A0A7D5RB81_9ARCH|nr:hypothetical protein [Nitrosopumilus ureiphilus]QLH07064.1 hypothetical protein C5F50_08280 [Nitrosopumilus ureiphilus]
MTTRNVKVTLMLAVVATLFVPISAMAINDNQSIGKTVFKTEIPQKVADKTLEKLQQLEEQRDQATSDAEKNQIQNQMDKIMQQAREQRKAIDPQRKAEYELKVDLLTDAIAQERLNISSTGKENVIPWTMISYDGNEDALAVGIHQDYAALENMQKYAQMIRALLGSDVDLVVYNGADYWNLGTCTSRTSDCTSIEAGVQMQVINHGFCTTGFKATFNSKSGFVTAGHCADNETGNNVGQATISNVIGKVTKETYNKGSSFETCDCAFIESTTSVDAKIFGVSIYPDHTGTAQQNDWVKMSGKKNGVQTGTVDFTSASITVKDGTTLVQVVIATYFSEDGDSGAPTLEAFSADPAFLGTNVAFNDAHTQSAYVKYSKFESHFAGIVWGF